LRHIASPASPHDDGHRTINAEMTRRVISMANDNVAMNNAAERHCCFVMRCHHIASTM
jgi:hypothetical protein